MLSRGLSNHMFSPSGCCCYASLLMKVGWPLRACKQSPGSDQFVGGAHAVIVLVSCVERAPASEEDQGWRRPKLRIVRGIQRLQNTDSRDARPRGLRSCAQCFRLLLLCLVAHEGIVTTESLQAAHIFSLRLVRRRSLRIRGSQSCCPISLTFLVGEGPER